MTRFLNHQQHDVQLQRRQVPTPPRASPRKGEAGNRHHRLLMNIRNNLAFARNETLRNKEIARKFRETSHISSKMDYHHVLYIQIQTPTIDYHHPFLLGDASLGMNAMRPEGCRSPILRSQSATVERSSSAPWFDGSTDSHDSMNQYQHVINDRIRWIDGGMDRLVHGM